MEKLSWKSVTLICAFMLSVTVLIVGWWATPRYQFATMTGTRTLSGQVSDSYEDIVSFDVHTGEIKKLDSTESLNWAGRSAIIGKKEDWIEKYSTPR